MKKTLKIACVAIILIIVAVMVIVNTSSATQINVSADDLTNNECYVDDTIQVTFSISGLCSSEDYEITEKETSIKILIDYDDSKFEYVENSITDTNYTVSPSATSVEVDGVATDNISFGLSFNAKASGSASFIITAINYRGERYG